MKTIYESLAELDVATAELKLELVRAFLPRPIRGSLWNLIRGRVAVPKLRYRGGDQAQPFAHDRRCLRAVHRFDVCGPGRPEARRFFFPDRARPTVEIVGPGPLMGTLP